MKRLISGFALLLGWLATAAMPALAADTNVIRRPPPTFVSTRYSTDLGLPNPRAQKVLQTRDGYIWIGTESGLARFDGLRFTTFPEMKTQPHSENIISALYEDQDGTLWIGHSHGLTRYRKGQFESVPEIQTAVTAIASGVHGRLWIACPSGSVWRFEKESFVRLQASARAVFEDSRGEVWAGNRNGLSRIVNDQFVAVKEAKDSILNVETLGESPDGWLWIGSAEGNFRFRDGLLKRWLPPGGERDEAAACFYTDRQGLFFLVSRRVYQIPKPANARPRILPVPDTDFPRTIIQDHEGSYWIGSRGDAVVRMRRSAFQTFSRLDTSLPNDAALTVAVDQEGVTWVGYARHGIGRISLAGDAKPFEVGLPPGSEISALGFDARDGMWIATRHSLYRWQDRKLEEFPRMKSVRAIFRDRNGTMWFGTQTAGITSLKDGVFTGYTMPGGNNTGLFFAENPAGEVFTGNRSALYKVVGHQLVEITGLPDKRVRAIHFDPDGNMWISTRDLGLAVFSGGRWFIPAAANEALLKLVTSINEDAQGNLWVGSGRGICRVSRTNLLAEARGETSAATLHFATQEDGVRPGYSAYGNYPFGAFGNYPITAVGPDGRIWFAQRTSVVAVNPPALRLNPSPPPVKIERVLADEQPVDASAGQITLPAGTRRLTIQYAALSFVQPARVLSSYRLVGADASWTPPSPGRSADYTGLPPGSYQFQVKACNSDGVWNETGDSLAFTVQPFYWQTLWFRLLVLASLAASGGFTVWRVVRTKLRRRERTISFQNTLLSLRDHAGDDLAAYFGMTTAGIATTLRVERASIWLFDAAHAAIVCQDLFCLSTRKHDRGLRLGAADYPAYFKTISSQGWVVADDARTNPATREFTESYLTPLDITSLLDAPLFVHGTLSGTLCCEHTGAARVWTTEEIEFVVSASSYVMLAMEQAERGKAEALKGAILESALDCIITINHEGKIIEFNPAAERTFGYSRGEALGRDMAELIVPPQFRERHHEGMAHFLTTGASPVVNQRLEMPAQRADGTEFPIELSIVRVGRTEPPQFTGFVRDITERKRAERDLMMSLSLLQATLESTTDGILVVNHERRIVSFNRKFIQMWSIPEAIIASRNDQQAIDFVLDQLKDPDGFLAKVKELYSHAEAESFDILELKSGRAFERYSQPQRVAGRSVGRVWSFRDVTERKQAEERLQQSHEQLRALSSRLESLREEERSRIAREIHDHLGQLLTALKLDMRSLERKIAGVAETELRVALAGKINSALMVADETIASVQKIASELRPGVLDRLGLPAAIEMETQAFQSRTGIPCKWNIPKDSVPLPQEHATAMFRIFQELLTNIARHAQATQVAVRLSCDEGELELHVKDDGVGIQPGDIENPKSLGLLGMRERVMILGGTIKFAGKSGKGTTVTVQLPFGKNTGQSV